MEEFEQISLFCEKPRTRSEQTGREELKLENGVVFGTDGMGTRRMTEFEKREKPQRIELYNDHFQNYKRYQIPKAQLVIADIPYNVGKNAYGSNPTWYVGGGQSQRRIR